MKSIALAILLFLASNVYAQQFSLFNTRTLFDSFENPAQKAFQPDSSKRFAFSFFPTIGINAATGGPAGAALRTLIFDDGIDGSTLTLGQRKTSRMFLNLNTYLVMLKAYTSLKGDEEMGLSWQLRSDNQATITNETIAIFDNYSLFDQNQYSGLFNNKGYSQSYHQLSFTYRTDVNRYTGVGLKLSYLSGIAYNSLKISQSDLNISSDADYYDLYIKGKVRTNFLYDDSIGTSFFMPGFKNPGMSVSASVNHHFPGGWFLLANLKDIGFIKWSNKSYEYSVDRDIAISNASASDADERLRDELNFNNSYTQKRYTTLIDGKAEILVNKDYGFYQPNFLLSKSLFYPGGDAVLINRFTHNSLNFSLSTGYNTSKILEVGSQFMIKKPNVEFYVGSDQLYKMINYAKAGIKDDKSIAKGYPGASFYIGFAAKFGYIIEHPMNANRIPDFNTGMGFFERMLRRIGIRL